MSLLVAYISRVLLWEKHLGEEERWNIINSSANLWRDEEFIKHEPGWGLLDLYICIFFTVKDVF